MSVSPGWYPDPDNPNQIRYHSGEQWTSFTKPRDGVVSAVEAEQEEQKEKPPFWSFRIRLKFFIILFCVLGTLYGAGQIAEEIFIKEKHKIAIDGDLRSSVEELVDPAVAETKQYGIALQTCKTRECLQTASTQAVNQYNESANGFKELKEEASSECLNKILTFYEPIYREMGSLTSRHTQAILAGNQQEALSIEAEIDLLSKDTQTEAARIGSECQAYLTE